MAKKRTTQVTEYLASLSVNEMDNTVSMPVEKRDWCVKQLKAVDARDEQGQKKRKKARR